MLRNITVGIISLLLIGGVASCESDSEKTTTSTKETSTTSVQTEPGEPESDLDGQVASDPACDAVIESMTLLPDDTSTPEGLAAAAEAVDALEAAAPEEVADAMTVWADAVRERLDQIEQGGEVVDVFGEFDDPAVAEAEQQLSDWFDTTCGMA